jgi:hypothetical protein
MNTSLNIHRVSSLTAELVDFDDFSNLRLTVTDNEMTHGGDSVPVETKIDLYVRDNFDATATADSLEALAATLRAKFGED